MGGAKISAEDRLSQLIERLVTTAEDAAKLSDWSRVRSVAEDVLTVDPGNERANALVGLARHSTGPSGQRALMTLLFSDLVGSTSLADATEPEVVRDIFQHYREVAAGAIDRYGGTIVNFLGDGIVAIFGFPTGHEDQASRAVSAGRALVDGMEAADEEARRRWGQRAEIRVGVHTGLVLVSDLGIGISVERDAIVGAAINMTARIQSEAEPGMVAISDVTRQLVEDDFAATSMGFRDLKGISRSVELFAVGDRHGAASRLESERYRRTELVGREELLDRLSRDWRRVVRGEQVRPVLLTGATGLGKSRMVAHLRNRALAAGADVVEFGCLPYHHRNALWPIVETLRRKLAAAGGDGPDRTVNDAQIVHRVEELCHRISVDPTVGVPLLAALVEVAHEPKYPALMLDPIAARQQLLSLLSQWLCSTEGGASRLIIIEDADWADPSTEDLIGLVTAHPTPGVHVVITSREPPAASWVAQVDLENLEPLTTEAARRMVARLVDRSTVDDRAIETIVERAEGIPLFLEELSRSATEAGESEPIPLRLRELLTARLHSAAIDLELTQVAATLGSTFDLGTLAAVADEPMLPDDIERLVTAEIIQAQPTVGADRYRFSHAMLRDAAYETQVLDRRRAVHAKVAAHLLSVGDDAALVANHFDEAGEPSQAAGQYLGAAQASHQRGANEEALRLSSRGIELVGEVTDDPLIPFTELGLCMVRALSVSSVYGFAAPTVEVDLRRAIDICEDHGTVAELTPTSIALWSFMLTAGQLSTSARLVAGVRRKIDQGIGPQFDAEVASCEGWQALYEGDLETANERLDAAVTALGQRQPAAIVSPVWPLPNDPLAVSAIGLAAVLTLRGDLVGGRDWEQRAVDRARSEPFPRGPFTHCFVATYQAWLRSILGDLAAARGHGRTVSAVAAEHGYLYWTTLGSRWQDIDDLDKVKQGLELQETVGHRAFQGAYLATMAELEAPTDPAQAVATVEAGLAAAAETGERVHLPRLLRLLARFRANVDGPSPATSKDWGAALDLARRQGNAIEELLAAAALAGLDPDLRPPEWRDVLGAAVARFTPDSDWAELTAAVALLEAG